MSDEYIRKQDAVDETKRYLFSSNVTNQSTWNECVKTITETLEELEPADVAPVVHGKWMKEDRGHVEYCAVCDQCGFDWMWSDRGYFKFCPNCGAKMDAQG